MNILEALNEQANFELESAYIYLGMSSYLADQDMPGMKKFMDLQAREEVEHAQKLIGFLQDVDHKVTYRPLDPGKQDYKSILDVFKTAYEHEKVVTKNIHNLVDQARKEDDKRVELFMGWYVKEQVEEEANFKTILTHLERAKDNWGALYQVDHWMGHRE